MTCYRPLPAARPVGSKEKPLVYARGRRPRNLAKGFEALELPCGQCIGCRLAQSQEWAIRIMHEASLHEDSSFITLTYSDKDVPVDGSLVRDHFTDFMKRLRSHSEQRFSYYMCGEYGETFSRPHYHACLLGRDFSDKTLISQTPHKLYTSNQLSKIWGKGFVTIGDLTYESAAYVARYCTKKVTGPRKYEHYLREHPLTGLVTEVEPEYATMSRRPAIGKNWFDEFESDVFPWDEVIHNGRSRKPPRYYDKLYEARNEQGLNQAKLRREAEAQKRAHDNTPARLEAKETVKAAQLSQLARKLEK